MELSFLLLLCVAGCSLSHAIPILVQETEIRETHSDNDTTVFEVKPTVNTDTYPDNDNRTVFDVDPTAETETHPDNDNRTIFGAIEAANKDISIFLQEGDINLKLSRSATSCQDCLWIKSPNGIVEVPYVISSAYSDDQRSVIAEALMEFQVMTCVQLVTRTTQTDYLSLESGPGCFSYIGRTGGKQTVSLSKYGCIWNGIVQHEIMHNLGFYHEHTRTDRDNYIDIMWENISPDYRSNFNIEARNRQSLPYDYSSVMHYDMYAYRNGYQPTIIPKPDPSVHIGQRIGMDNLDVMKINNLYNCNLCRMKFIDISGSFSYNSATSGQQGSSCLWMIRSYYKVLLHLSDIIVPSSSDCSDRYITVYDGVSKLSPVLLQKTCGNVEVPPLTSSGKTMLVEFVNNKPEITSSFKASYNTLTDY